jgi:hypothetical protein
MQQLMHPRKSLLPTFLLFISLLSGCSSSSSVRQSTYGEINERLREHEVRIELKDGTALFAKDVTIADDSVSWLNVETNERSTAGIQRLNRVVIKSYWLGGLEGFGFGALVGAAVGALSTSSSSYGFFGHEAGLLFALAGGIAGGIIGFIPGILIGHSFNFTFPPNEESSPAMEISFEKSLTHNDVLFLKDSTVARGTIIEIVIEKASTGIQMHYRKNGSIHRAAIVSELDAGNHLRRVTIQSEQGVAHSYEASEIWRIEKTE